MVKQVEVLAAKPDDLIGTVNPGNPQDGSKMLLVVL